MSRTHILQNTRESAVRREEFHRLLKGWLDESLGRSIGDPEGHAGPAWLWVRHGGSRYYLSAHSTREGVRRYLELVEAGGGDPHWTPTDATPEVRERVAVGPEEETVEGFEFYLHLPTR